MWLLKYENVYLVGGPKCYVDVLLIRTKESGGEIYWDVEIRSTKCGSLEVESDVYVSGAISFEETARPREFLL